MKMTAEQELAVLIAAGVMTGEEAFTVLTAPVHRSTEEDVVLPCPRTGLRPRRLPVLTPDDVRVLPLCVCAACESAYFDDDRVSASMLAAWDTALGRSLAVWAYHWCVAPRRSKRFVGAEDERLEVVDSLVRLAPETTARRALLLLVRGTPWV